MEAARGGWMDITNSESPEFIGRVIAALNGDPQLMARTGRLYLRPRPHRNCTWWMLMESSRFR